MYFCWVVVHRRGRLRRRRRRRYRPLLVSRRRGQGSVSRGRTVVCLSKIKHKNTSNQQHRPISSINKKARKKGISHLRELGKAKREKCRVLRFPRPGRTCDDPAGREIGFHCRRERQHSASHLVKTFRPRTWAQHQPASRTTVPP